MKHLTLELDFLKLIGEVTGAGKLPALSGAFVSNNLGEHRMGPVLPDKKCVPLEAQRASNLTTRQLHNIKPEYALGTGRVFQ